MQSDTNSVVAGAFRADDGDVGGSRAEGDAPGTADLRSSRLPDKPAGASPRRRLEPGLQQLSRVRCGEVDLARLAGEFHVRQDEPRPARKLVAHVRRGEAVFVVVVVVEREAELLQIVLTLGSAG